MRGHEGVGWRGNAVFRESSGQMAVELAVLIPVIVACALVVVNVMRYAELCARFDRVGCGACPWRVAFGGYELVCGR